MSAPCPVFGFTVWIDFHPAASDADRDALIDALIEVLETNDLMFANAGDRSLEYVVTREAAQATDADRELLRVWAAPWTHVAAIQVSDITDLSEVV